MKRCILVIVISWLMSVIICGCGKNEIPDLTEDEMKAVGEFAAFSLMKYDANNRSRLVNLDKYVVVESVPLAEKPEEEPAGMGEVEDTPIVEIEPSEEIVEFVDLGSVLELPENVFIRYDGTSRGNVYPENPGGRISVVAEQGKQVLVLYFNMENSSVEEQYIDIFGMNQKYAVVINGDEMTTCSITLLPNDLSTMRQKVGAGESLELLLLTQIDANIMEIDDITLRVSCDDASYNVRLQ